MGQVLHGSATTTHAMLEAITAVPILVEKIAVPKVSDAGAANPAQTREGHGVRVFSEGEVDPLAAMAAAKPPVSFSRRFRISGSAGSTATDAPSSRAA